jgi:outer membrane protein OmpA-like peptidoglycan-associated protein
MQFRPCTRLVASFCRILRSRPPLAAFAIAVGTFGCSQRAEPVAKQQLAATFPAPATAWTPVPQAGAGISDPLADGMNNGREVVGSSTDAAVYIYTDGVDFFVRLRVDDDPSQGDTVRPFGWGLLIDTNNDFAAYEYSLMVDGTGNPKSVVLSQNTTPGTTGDPGDKAETILNTTAVNTAAGGNLRITQADTSFNMTPDFFLDYSVSLAAMQAAGFTLSTPLRVVAGTSSSGNSISVDVAGTGNPPGPGVLQEAASDTISLTGASADNDADGVFNPTDLDDDNDGIPDASENLLGLNPDGDEDTDGVPNWQDATNQGNGTVSTCLDAGTDGLCDAPSSVYDTDRDGIPNHLDLDSDDDGIADLSEAGHRAVDATNDGMADGPYGANGWSNALETAVDSGVLNYTLLDTENDDIPDFIDLDSDGDGAFDLAEVGKSAVDTNADGRIDASSLDADKDGLRAAADADETKYGFPSVAVGTFNADTDGIPDPYDPLAGALSDSDADGFPDAVECAGGWPCPDTDLDGTPNYMVGLLDDDGDGVPNNMDSAPADPNVCKDTDLDTCDDCSVTGADGSGGSVTGDGLDSDTDGLCNAGDPDDDNDGVLDGPDSAPLDPNVCKDTDLDTCDDCAVTGANASGGSVTNDGLDTDADGTCDATDPDKDNDGVLDGADSAPLNPNVCKDTDLDTCDDCAVTGANASGGSVTNDGPDTDVDGICDAREDDDDNDGVLDGVDSAPLDPNVCKDTDLDTCDDCAVTGANASGGSVTNDGLDTDVDGACDASDDDDDNDGVLDGTDSAPLNPNLCKDTDADGCDDCAVTGADESGGSITNDGPDSDTDGICDAREDDDDNDGVLDGTDSAPLNPNQCRDVDDDSCDDCAVTGADGSGGNLGNDGLDTDTDGECDAGDVDDDNDGVSDGSDSAPLDPALCQDTDADTCDDCAVTQDDESGGDPDNDGTDTDGDGTCDAGADSDGDGVPIPTDLDADNDGIPNALENLEGIDPLADADNDGIANFSDAGDRGDGQAAACMDANSNGRCDSFDPLFDTDADGTPNHLDLDADGDSLSDLDEAGHGADDANRDGMLEGPVGANGLNDALETADESGIIDYELSNVDGDDKPDFLDTDSDGDNINDAEEAGDDDLDTVAVDSDGDTIPDYRDSDSDNDTITDRDEAGDSDASTPAVNTDSDDKPDYLDDDSDGDGTADEDEAGDTDPATPPIDSDDDDVPDFQDPDSDDDGVLDGVDNCRLVANANQLDSDDDGVGDACEGDADGDGVLDPADNCPMVANANQADADDDGVGDACEDTTPADSDDDGVADADDNCPNADNPDQADADDDGVGDACEMPVEMPTDSDGDGVADEDDDCPDEADAAQSDRDGDGLGDVCDRDANGDGFDDDIGVQGGGCSVSVVSGTGSAWGTALLAVLGMTLAGRARRRRRAARAAVLGMGVAGLLTGRSAHAQDTQIPAERFRLASTREGILDVESGKVGKQLSFDVGLWLGYAKDPLTVYRAQGGDEDQVGALIGDRFGGALAGSLAVVDQLQLGLTLPLVLAQQESGGTGIPNASPDSFGLGNLEVAPKLQMLRQDQVGLDISLLVGVMLPTTTSDDYFGDDGFVATPELALSRNFGGGVHGALNAGYRFRKRAQLLNLVVNDEIIGRAGLAYRFKDNGGPPLELGLTGSTATAAKDPFKTPNQDYAELIFGAGYDIVSTEGKTMKGAWQLFGAGGMGIARGFGTPEYRALLGVRLAVGPVDEPPPSPPAAPAPVDTDGDGLLDNVDKCPEQPEVKNGFQDEDGCPDEIPDTDGDGLRDPDDKCPQEPEDKDTFQDEDGCPDPDNDADGILDAEDRCPMEPGPKETRGCPDPDRDKDTVVDRLDNCPDEPGKPELQGCKEKQLVRIAETSIEILEVVHFEYNKAVIQKRSFKLLDDVARVIVAHPELEQIRVEGHTDDRGNDAYNKKLSQSRAESVQKYLIERGVAANRLQALGHGEENPIADNKTEAGRTQNRRVEFKIVDTKAK